ncbi:MAG: hypothetical protein WBE26_17730, partial [Phycisphaerae bacterium]
HTPRERLGKLTAILANGIHRSRTIAPAPPECRQIPGQYSPTALDLGARFDPYTIVESRATQPAGLRTPCEALSNEAQGRLRELMESLDPLGKLAARARISGRRPETGGRRLETGERRAPVKNDGRPGRRDEPAANIYIIAGRPAGRGAHVGVGPGGYAHAIRARRPTWPYSGPGPNRRPSLRP